MKQQEDDLSGFDIDPDLLEEMETSLEFTIELIELKEADLSLLNKPPKEATARGRKRPYSESFSTDGPGVGHETALMVPPVDTSVRKPKDGRKVRQPPSAFILFGREWRCKLATE
ncbi:hypothetical protein B7P43_G09712 [Cryptotermes secundus]|uniref:Uncharacterized protein n=1 Tax=Cryptotermes secundus TaxID=105785 RepID=A0A2J7PVR9_9NEOP|nr:uncharacterized protein LOC111871490 [Cryptotermes secundus]XP_023720417.1 uncharacterized protein LOC111871490 [Cryptotermes secundus]XP_023720418.1 uncharacterized protein LOC111871490 [Cryptotermes secundus]PNF20400.1 hypothetical protein B7P43_G09712 [Cryptotermes secundus]